MVLRRAKDAATRESINSLAQRRTVYTRGAAPIKFNSAAESRPAADGTTGRILMPPIHKVVNLTNVRANLERKLSLDPLDPSY